MPLTLGDCPCDEGTDDPKSTDLECHLEDIDGGGIAFGAFLWFGIFLAFAPQLWKIYSTKSHLGLSYWLLFLGSICQFLILANLAIFNYPKFAACETEGVGECFPSLFSFIQTATNTVFFFAQYPMYLKFYKFDGTEDNKQIYKRAHSFFYALILIIIIIITITASLMGGSGACSKEAEGFASGCGLLSAAIGVVQWYPQIRETYRLKICGSISLITLAFGVVGSTLFFIFQAFITKEDWTTWIGIVVSMLLQGGVFCMAAYYQYFYKGPRPLDDQIYEEIKDNPPASANSKQPSSVLTDLSVYSVPGSQ